MKKGILILLLAGIAAGAGWSQTKKYDIKSGIVTYETIMKLGRLEMTMKTVVYFDEYGRLERRDTYENGAVTESFMSDGTTLFSLIHGEKTAYRQGSSYRGTELAVDWNSYSRRDKESGAAKLMPPMTVLGRSCEVIQYTGRNTTMTVAGLHRVLVFSETKSSSTETTQMAVEFKENAQIPAVTFKVPAGYAVKDM